MFKVHAVIQSTVPGSNDSPVVVTYYNGPDKTMALAALASVVAHDDARYTELLSVTFTDTSKKARL